MQSKIEAFARQLAEEFGEIDEENALIWLDAIETRAVEIGDAVTTELLKKKSVRQPAEEKATCPKCGQLGRYRGQRQREMIGHRGPVTRASTKYVRRIDFCFTPKHGSWLPPLKGTLVRKMNSAA